mgnify:CR=1 FL=1
MAVIFRKFQKPAFLIILFINVGCMAPKGPLHSEDFKERFKVYSNSELQNLNYKRLSVVESFHL